MKVHVLWIAAWLIWRIIKCQLLMPADLRSTSIEGVFELVSQPFVDARGAFLNAFRIQDDSFIYSWGNRGIAQVNVSRNETVGTVRGMHLQASPHGEAKLVRCLRGKVWDVVVDLRKDSVTFAQWFALELTPNRGNALLVPEGCAHGFQVLESGSELLYLHSGDWVSEAETGIRWNDPYLAIHWPLTPTLISSKDAQLPFLL